MSTVPYAKMNGIGNSILVVDLRGSDATLDGATARRLGADERLGVLVGASYDRNNRSIQDLEGGWSVDDAGRSVPVEWDHRDYVYGRTRTGGGGTVDYLVDTVLNYPTLSEAYKVAALDVANKLRAVARFSNQLVTSEPSLL